MSLRTAALLVLSPLLCGCAHVFISSPFDAGRAGPAVLVEGPVALARLEGEPSALGAQRAALMGEQLRDLHETMFELAEGRVDLEAVRKRVAQLEAQTPARYLAELEALAADADVDRERLLGLNMMVDVMCSAVVAPDPQRPAALMIGRNMDFGPAHLLGRNTVLEVVRARGQRPFVSVGWPGYVGVVSGMNDAGLCAMILLNHEVSEGEMVGTPLAFRVREVLERAGSVAEARQVFSSGPVATDDFVLIADAREAIACYQKPLPGGGYAVHELRHREAISTLTNGKVDPLSGLQSDRRSLHLDDLVAERRALSLAEMRALLGAVYLEHINCQAMIFHPGARAVQLAIGTTTRPASHRRWYRYELAEALGGGSLEGLGQRVDGDEPDYDHYKDVDGEQGARLRAALRQAHMRRLRELLAIEEPLLRMAELLAYFGPSRWGLRLPASVDRDLEEAAAPAMIAGLEAVAALARDADAPRGQRQVAAARWLAMASSAAVSLEMPDAVADRSWDDVRAAGELLRELGAPPAALGAELDAKAGGGWLVTEAPQGHPLQKGDRVVAVDGRGDRLAPELARARRAGQTVLVLIVRDGQQLTLQVAVAAR